MTTKQQNRISHVASVSSGKDSTATLLLALKQFPDSTIAVFADTGNEHQAVYEYLDYTERELDIEIVRLKQDFTEWWWHRRDYVRDKWPEKGVPPQAVDRALALFEQGPSGNPYLDLCTIKGRFPSRMAQFCTQYLKVRPLTEFCMDVVEQTAGDVWSWQGVRRDESQARRNALGHEYIGPGMYAHRPIAGWTAQQTVDFVRSCGLKLNPLYEQGMTRVGCMPCVNANKDDIAEMARRFPEHIERIAEWERIVAEGSKRQEASFFPNPDRDAHLDKRGIHNIVRWAKTFRGGKVNDPRWDDAAPACASSYGLCE